MCEFQFLQSWTNWQAARPLEETIKLLYQDADQHRREMARQLAVSSTVAPDQADRIVWHSLRHVLHMHVRRLRDLGTETGSIGDSSIEAECPACEA